MLILSLRLRLCLHRPCRNDAAILSTNPELTLPAEPITVVQLKYGNNVNLAASLLCDKVDAGWTANFGVTYNPPLTHVVDISMAQGTKGLAAYVLDTPYSIGWLSPVSVRTQIAQLINQAGKTVAPTTSTVTQASLELTSNGIMKGGVGFDLSNAQSAFAWPASVSTSANAPQPMFDGVCHNHA